MKYLFDTDVCIYFMKGTSERLYERMFRLGPGEAGVSSIVLAELYLGVEKSARKEKNLLTLLEFLQPHGSLNFDDSSAIVYAEIRAGLEQKGRPIGHLDTLIAAQALSQNLTLITNNEREFSRVPGLKIENWTRG